MSDPPPYPNLVVFLLNSDGPDGRDGTGKQKQGVTLSIKKFSDGQ